MMRDANKFVSWCNGTLLSLFAKLFLPFTFPGHTSIIKTKDPHKERLEVDLIMAKNYAKFWRAG